MYYLLRPLKILTRELSTKKYVMFSKVIPIISGTRNDVIKQNPTQAIAVHLKKKF